MNFQVNQWYDLHLVPSDEDHNFEPIDQTRARREDANTWRVSNRKYKARINWLIRKLKILFWFWFSLSKSYHIFIIFFL